MKFYFLNFIFSFITTKVHRVKAVHHTCENTLPVNIISLEKVITTDFLFALKLLPYFNLLAPKDFLIIWLQYFESKFT